MIYYEHRSLFIHIPRTSGVSVARAVLTQKDPEATGVNVVLGHGLGPYWRHAAAHVLREAVPEWDSPDLRKFTIVRNPWRICESTYRQFRRKQEQIADGLCTWFDPEIKERVARHAESSFEEFVLSHFDYLRQGFFAHWALEWGTFEELGVRPFRFEELGRDWPEVCDLLQLPRSTARPWDNAAAPCETVWTDQAVEFIHRRCRFDFEMFGYPEQP